MRCHLENSAPAWNPWTSQDIDKLETVQKRAVSYCRGLSSVTYEEKLKEIGLTTLLERRHRSDMLETYKVLKGISDVDYHTWFTKVHEHNQNKTSIQWTPGTDLLNSKKTLLSIHK